MFSSNQNNEIAFSLQQYGLDPQDWFCVKTATDESSYLIRSKEDPDLMLLGRQNPQTQGLQDLQLFSL